MVELGDGVAGDRSPALEAVLPFPSPEAVPEPADRLLFFEQPASLSAACVHADGHGTRSAMTVVVPQAGLPAVRVADGKPCQTELTGADGLWAAGSRRP